MKRSLPRRIGVLYLALALGGLGWQPEPAGASVPNMRAGAPVAETAPLDQPTLVSARALLQQARTAYHDKRDQEAVALVDRSLSILRQLLVVETPRTLRVAAGEIFRSCASLRLSATRRTDRARDLGPLIGPAVEHPDEFDAEDSPLAEALLNLSLTPTGSDPEEPVASSGRAADAGHGETAPTDLPQQAGAELPAPSGELDAPDWTEPELSALPEEQIVPGPNADPTAVRLRRNSRVQKWIDYYSGRGRDHYERYLARSGRYEDWMRGVLRSEGLPEEIVHLVFVESGFNTEAVSRSYAVGQWQFIRGTARLFDLRMNSYVDERKDPELATRAAARYLKHLFALFQDWDLALASYNCGEGRTIRTIAKTGKWDYWALPLPREAMHYVPKYMACLALAGTPERYGLGGADKDPPLEFDTIHLPGAYDARALAAACGISYDSLLVLNPSYRKAVTAPRDGISNVRVPKGQGGPLVAAMQEGTLDLPKVAFSAHSDFQQHRVRRGETLGGISRRYRVPMREIASVNHMRINTTLRVGQRLLIPERGVATAGGASRAFKGGNTTYSSVKSVRIQRGDTLSGLASRHQTDVGTLRALNNLRPKQAIRAGGVLKVPVR